MTRFPEQQHEKMEWEEQESVMSDMVVDPNDWLKMEKSRDRAIRLRRASCQGTAWRKLQKEKGRQSEWLVERAMLEWSKSMLVTLTSVQRLIIKAGVVAMLESGHLEKSGMMKERGKVVKWSLKMVTVSATEHIKQRKEELADHLKEEKKRFAGEEAYEHSEISNPGNSDARRGIRQMINSDLMRKTWLTWSWITI